MWKTGITKIEPNHIVIKGYTVEELMGRVPFSHTIFLLLKGRLPDEAEGKMIDAILTSSVDHGVTPPTALASRIIASAGVPLPTAVAGGLLAVGDVHGGAIEQCAQILQEWAKKGEPLRGEGRGEPQEVAKKLLSELKSQGKRMPGIGHRIHTKDPRAKRLFELAEELKIKDCHIELLLAIEKEINEGKKKSLPINVDGAIGAVISDLGFDFRIGKAFFLLSRAAGLVAQVYEEMTRERPMRRICEAKAEYDGPWERKL